MSESEEQFQELRLLIDKAIEGILSDEELKELDSLIVNEPELRRYYCEYLCMNIGLDRFFAGDISEEHLQNSYDQYDEELWSELARHEKEAQLLEIIKEPQPRDMIVKKLEITQAPRQLNRFWLYTALISTAALILMLAYIRFTPHAVTKEVATLTDSIGAKWSNTSLAFIKGDRLLTNQAPANLLSGIIKLTYDEGAELIIEGPTEFEISASELITVNYGRLFVRVSPSSTGFTVDTPNSRIVDLGTEFGVCSEIGGDVEVHVFKGETTLVAGAKDKERKVRSITSGMALRVRQWGTEIQEIQLEEEKYVRQIDSEKNIIWRGQDLNLADIFTGGTGLDTSPLITSIDPESGKIITHPYKPSRGYRNGIGFLPVRQIKAIDGVFVPDGGSAKVVISSMGHFFENCPDTSGEYWSDITIDPRVNHIDGPLTPSVLAGKTFRPGGISLLFLHSNTGITFDLDRIRLIVPQADIVRFKSLCGVSENVGFNNKAQFWVLVDGLVRFQFDSDGPVSGSSKIDIELKKTDRFLTLVTTDGGDGVGYDWCLFTEPVLELN